MKLHLMTKMLAGYLSVVALLLVVAFVSLSSLTTVTSSYQDITHRLSRLQIDARSLQANVADGTRAVTGYIATGDASYKTEFFEINERVVSLLGELETLIQTTEAKAIHQRIVTAKANYDTVGGPLLEKTSFTAQEAHHHIGTTLRGPRLELMAAIDELVVLAEGTTSQMSTQTDETASRDRAIVIGVAAAAAVAAVLLALIIARSISRPVNAVAQAAQRLAAGDLTLEELQVSSRDEVGAMADAFNQMVKTLREVLTKVNESTQAVTIASDQLSSAAEDAAHAASGTSQAITQVAAGASEQSRATAEVNSTVEQVQSAIQQIASGASKSAADIQDAAALLNQMVSELDQMADSSVVTSKEADQAAKQAQAGADVVDHTLREIEQIGIVVGQSADRIRDLARLTEQIGAITEVISGIADQTNLLALNAAIEAARAGEHGRGFAVVAEEVRKLAERSATSTNEINDLIHNIQAGTAEAVKAMEAGTERVAEGNRLALDAGQALSEILTVTQQAASQMASIAQAADKLKGNADRVVSAFNDVATLTEENTAATEEMAAGSAEVTRAVNHIARVSQENAAASEEVSASVEELTASSEEVSAAAQSLARTAQELQEQVKRFKL